MSHSGHRSGRAGTSSTGGGRRYDQRETFYLVWADSKFDVAPRLSPEALVSEGIGEQRWWTLDELEVAGVLTAPRRLVQLLRSLAAGGPPSEPFDAGV